MDLDIVNCIINGVTTKSDLPENPQSTEFNNFSSVNTLLIDKLSKSLTTLLSYKVSQEVYNRYSIRLKIIETLRDLCRLKGNLRNLRIFQDTEESFNFFIGLLKKHIKEETLNNFDNPDDLIEIAETLLNAQKSNKSLVKKYFTKVLVRIIDLNQTSKSKKFLEYIFTESDSLKLDFSLVEQICLKQRTIFIEEPVNDCFMGFCSDQTRIEKFKNIDCLLNTVSKSPILFQLLSKQLKEYFVTTEYSNLSLNFIQIILEKIKFNCDKNGNDILNLYPTNLQHCIVLLRVKPSDHTEKSKIHTIDSLKEAFMDDSSGVLSIISHFPDWLPDYLKFFEIIENTIQKCTDILTGEDESVE